MAWDAIRISAHFKWTNRAQRASSGERLQMKNALMIALAASGAAAALLAPSTASACACGCGVFDVGESSLMPADAATPFTVWFRYNYMNQNQNWEGSSKAPAADNDDKRILTSFYTVGGSYMINRDWTVMAELPTYQRAFTTTDDDGTIVGPPGTIFTGHLFALGDLQLTGVYTGLAKDMSTGLSLGVKLPTGDYKGPSGPLGGLEFDRDSLPGTGSTDLMLGGYHTGMLNTAQTLGYFVQARYQFAVATRDSYRPGNEFDAAAGVSYNLGGIGPITKVAPVLQVINSMRDRDSGSEADPLNSGYERLLIAPGINARINQLNIFADVELPLYQHTNAASSVSIEGASGQLVASALFKTQLSYSF